MSISCRPTDGSRRKSPGPSRLPEMPPLQQEIQVCFRYPVHFTTDLFAPENPLLAQVTEEGVGREALGVRPEGSLPDQRPTPNAQRLNGETTTHPAAKLRGLPDGAG